MQGTESGGTGPAPLRTPGNAKLWKSLNIAAVLLAVAALVVNVAGPGPRGPDGPPGPGSLIAGIAVFNATPIDTTCTHHSGTNLTMVVPAPGTIVVRGVATFPIAHVTGDYTEVDLAIGTSPTDCSAGPWATFAYIAAAEPSDTYWVSVPLLEAFTVSTAGPYTYCLNGRGELVLGHSAEFAYTSLVAVFHPS